VLSEQSAPHPLADLAANERATISPMTVARATTDAAPRERAIMGPKAPFATPEVATMEPLTEMDRVRLIAALGWMIFTSREVEPDSVSLLRRLSGNICLWVQLADGAQGEERG
jgi:hypothetical protein